MPKRSTQVYTSQNAPPLPDTDKLRVYYCKVVETNNISALSTSQ